MTGSNTNCLVLIRDVVGSWVILAISFAGTLAVADPAPPVASLKELYARLGQCLQQPNTSTPSDLTVVFSLKRDGSLLGRPRITHSQLGGDEAQQEAFVRSVLSDLSRCLPLRLSDGLGGAVAGRPLILHIQNKAASVGI